MSILGWIFHVYHTQEKVYTYFYNATPCLKEEIFLDLAMASFFNEGSWISEAWRREHPDAAAEEAESPPERIPTTQERMARLDLERIPENAMCVRSSGTPPPHDVRLTSAEGITQS